MSKQTPARRAPALPRPVPDPARHLLSRYAGPALVLLALLAYANAFGGDFVLDSRVIVLEDPRIREVSASNLGLISNRSYWWPYKTADDLYRPVTTLSYLFNYAILGNGTRPAGYHVLNVLLHAVNVLLAYGIALRVSRRLLGSLALAAVWAVHPLATEAVTNIVGRADLLAGFGVLAALYAYIRASEPRDAVRASTRGSPSAGASAKVGWWLFAAAGAATVGVFSKESASAIAGIVVLYDVFVREPRRPVTALLPGWLVMSVPLLLLLYRRSAVLGSLPPVETLVVDNPVVGVGFWQGLLTAAAVLPRYVWLTIWPVWLSADYSYAQMPAATGTLADWLGWLAFALLTAAAVVAGRRRPLVAFAASAALVALLPASNLLFPTGTIMGERLAYLPTLGTLACVGLAIASAGARVNVPPRVAVAVVGVLVALLTARTWARNADWNSEVSIWHAAVEVVPRSFKAHQGYADALYESDPDRSNLADVVAHSHRSAEILATLPDHQSVSRVYRLAAVYAMEYADQLRASGGESAEAESRQMYEAGVRYAQRHVDVVIATRAGEGATAADVRGDAVRDLADAYRLLATAHGRVPDGQAALAAAERAGELEPLSPLSYRSTAAAQVAAGRFDDAAATFIAGFMVTGDQTLRDSVIDLYRSGLDRDGCATTVGPSGPTLNPACEPVRRHLCLASRDAAQTQRARGRNDLAENLETAALESFGCPSAFFTPAS